jgi:predicted dehydrogenase
VRDKARLGFIGVGGWGRKLASAAIRSDAAVVAAGYARSESAREAFAAEFDCAAVPTLEQLLDDASLDGVVVSTPHTTHADLVVQAAKAGRNVFVEKPLAVSVDSGRRAVDAAAQAGIVLQVGHNRRFQTANRRIRQLIESGGLGVVHQVEANMSAPTAHSWAAASWRTDPAELPGGGLTVMGVHMIDTLHYLVGTPSLVFGRSKRILGLTEVDEATGALLEFGDGPIGYLASSVVIPNVVTVAVFGSEGSVWNEQDGTRLFVQRRGEPARAEVPVEVNDPLVEELREFARCARTGERPEVDGEVGLAAVRTMMAIVDSARSGQPVSLTPTG